MEKTIAEINAANIAGLREFANWLEANPQDHEIHIHSFVLAFTGQESVAKDAKMLAPCRKAVGGTAFKLVKNFGPIEMVFHYHRDTVCERVVTKETKIVKEFDPEVQAITKSKPMIEVEREVETVTWNCPPSILAAGVSQ